MKVIIEILCIIAVLTVVFAENIETVTKGESQEYPSTTRQPSLQAYGLPKRFLLNNGEIKRIQLRGHFAVDSDQRQKTSTWKYETPTPQERKNQNDFVIIGHIERESVPSRNRSVSKRSIDNHEKDDLETQETIIFRPLFVHRQQMAERHRAERSKNPIYGAYQYGTRRPVNYSRNNYRNVKNGHDNRSNALH